LMQDAKKDKLGFCADSLANNRDGWYYLITPGPLISLLIDLTVWLR